MGKLIPNADEDIGSFFDKRFTGKWDLPEPMVVKITGVERGEIEARKDNAEKGIKRGDKQRYPFLHIRNLDGDMKPIKMNKTMQDTMICLYGRKPREWIGKFITIFHDQSVTFGKTKVGGIKIEAEIPNVSEASPPQAPAKDADEQKRVLKEQIEREETREEAAKDPPIATGAELLERAAVPATKEEQSVIWKAANVGSRAVPPTVTKAERDEIEARLKANRIPDPEVKP